MKVGWLLVVVLLNLNTFAVWAEETRMDRGNKEVLRETISAIHACTHWAGEVGDQSEERNQQIEKGVARDCSIAKRKADAALKLFPKNPDLAESILELNDAGHFELTSQEKNRLCQNALPAFRQRLSKKEVADVYLQQQCPRQFETLQKK